MRVTLVLTHDCNLACSYCYTGEKFARSMADRVGWEALHLGFRGAVREGQLNVSFFGGEPLLEFPKMVRFTRLAWAWARRQRVPLEFQVTTNATILTPRILEFFRHYPYRVAFSVDGLEGAHDRHRSFSNGKPSSTPVWRNLEKAVRRLPRASIHMVLNPDTLDGLEAAVKRLAELGYREITLLPNMDTLWSSESRAWVRDVYAGLASYMASFPAESPLVVSPIYDMGLESPRLKSCGFGTDDLAVSPTGALYPCARLVGADHREPIQLGHVRTGVDESRIKNLKARARAKQVGCGSEGGCACATFMPGDILRQLENLRFFDQLAASVWGGTSQGVTLHV